MQDALSGNAREVLEKYNAEIAAERTRKAHSRNAFVRQCCDQAIERLTREKRQIEAATID
jgi:hypothetical protein